MKKFADVSQSADSNIEKHIPLIECSASIKSGELFDIKVTIGKEVAHPNTIDHYIRWIQVFFQPQGGEFACQIATCELKAHGEAVEGADKGPAYTNHSAIIAAKLNKPGTIYALSLCNNHRLWENSREIKVE